MTDRTSVAVVIYECAPESVRAVRKVLDTYEVLEGEVSPETVGPWDTGRPIADDELLLGVTYGAHDIAMGWTCSGIVEALIEAAPDLVFHLWEDPAYGEDGVSVTYTPELGMFTTTCINGGTPVLTWDALATAPDEHALGMPWKRQLDTVAEQLHTRVKQNGDEARVVKAPPVSACEDILGGCRPRPDEECEATCAAHTVEPDPTLQLQA